MAPVRKLKDLDDRIEQADRRRAVGERFSEDDPALMVSGARLDPPGQLEAVQTIE